MMQDVVWFQYDGPQFNMAMGPRSLESDCGRRAEQSTTVKDDGPSSTSTINEYKAFIEKVFEKQEIITERIDRIMAVIAEFEQNFKDIFDNLGKLEEKVFLCRNIIDIKTSLECERQYNRSKNSIATSIPQTEREDVGKITVNLL
ncbi:hypothetical protein J6590_070615 [Homalodisca vitripennis]|nr:hypothetical protein J6590_070615 [Homalodisca vitripennis]